MPSGEPILPAPAPEELRAGPLRMRPLTDGDEQLLRAMSRDADIVRWTTIPADLDEAGAHDRLRRMVAGFFLNRLAVYVLELDGTAVGTAGVGVDVDGVEVFYAVLPAGRRRGVATAAADLLTGWALSAGSGPVSLLTFPDNDGSQRVAERAGFRRDGTVERAIKGIDVELLRWRRDPV